MSQKRFTLPLSIGLIAVLLAGCGQSQLGTAVNANGFGALASKKFAKYGLGADLKGAPKVRFDEGGANKESAGEEVSAMAALPTKVDLRDECPPVYNQGTMGSCTGFAIAKGLGEFMLKKQNRHTELSALYLYYMERKQAGNIEEDAGAQISSGVKILNTIGCAAEKDHAYPPQSAWDNQKKMFEFLTLKPENSDTEAGKSFRLQGVKQLGSLRGIRSTVAKGLPAVFGIAIFESFYEAKNGVIPVPDVEKEKMLGGHAVTCVGYDNEKQVLIMRNSWGTSWGDKGYFYMPYDFVRKGLVMDAWTAKL